MTNDTGNPTWVDTPSTLSPIDAAALNAIEATLNGKAPKISPTFVGVPKAPTQPHGTADTSIASTAFVADAVAGAAPAGTLPTGGATGTILRKTGTVDFAAAWGTDYAVVEGSAMNPHPNKMAARNANLPVNFWQYTGVPGTDDPTNWQPGDRWIYA